jgi:pyridoxal phosphate enzyme (YggS family)
MNRVTDRIQQNVERVRDSIAAAAQRSNRDPREITLVAVTKYVSPELILPLVEAGCRDFGESRPQQLWEKAGLLQQQGITDVRWHLIGHLQRNKIAKTIPWVHMIQSVDSDRLLTAIELEISDSGPGPVAPLPVLLEVNVSEDAAKHGWAADQMPQVVSRLGQLHQVKPVGLMGMASLSGGEQQARADFHQLRELRDQLQTQSPAGVLLTELSMGMSGDYEVAIEEGATIVRIGSSLFEGVV